MHVTYTHIAYGPASHNVSAVLHWAAISVLGMEYGRWPTVVMHTAVGEEHLQMWHVLSIHKQYFVRLGKHFKP